ncbi:hypothetical protein TomTYG45_06530 [Sphingobium sp. TomTYG45]
MGSRGDTEKEEREIYARRGAEGAELFEALRAGGILVDWVEEAAPAFAVAGGAGG